MVSPQNLVEIPGKPEQQQIGKSTGSNSDFLVVLTCKDVAKAESSRIFTIGTFLLVSAYLGPKY